MSKGGIGAIIGFVIGAAAGFMTGHVLTKKKIEKDMDEIIRKEVNSVKESYKNRIDRLEELGEKIEKATETKPKLDVDAIEKARNKPDFMEYAEILASKGYNTDPDESNGTSMTSKKDRNIYMIPEEKLGDNGFEVERVCYWTDGFISDFETNDVIEPEDWIDLIGNEWKGYFNNDEDCDEIFVRNDRLRIDYIIIRQADEYTPSDEEDEDEDD